jgi:hypothetical protein
VRTKSLARTTVCGQVVDICVGRSVPEVNNFRALPTPSGAIWPQFLLDISYRGLCLSAGCLPDAPHSPCTRTARCTWHLIVPRCPAGDAWVIVETKVDLRSSTAWSQFDEAIGHFGGEAADEHAEPALALEEEEATDGDTPCQIVVSTVGCAITAVQS